MNGAATKDVNPNEPNKDGNDVFRHESDHTERSVPGDVAAHSASESARGSQLTTVQSEPDAKPTNKAPYLVVVSDDAENADLMGRRLRAARESRGLSLADVAKATKIRRDYLENIEDMQVDDLPGMPQSKSYLRGWLKTYARFVEMPDVDEVVNRYLGECGHPCVTETGKNARHSESAVTGVMADRLAASKSGGGFVAGLFTALAIIGAVGAAVWFLGPWSDEAGAPLASTSPNTAPASAVASRPQLGASFRAANLSLKALTTSWIEVRGADGTVYLSKEMSAGDIYVPRVGAGWTVTVQDGAAFEWRLNGESLGRIAEEGGQVHAASIDAVLQRAASESAK